MAVIKDLRNETPKRKSLRPESRIRKIVMHHSATTQGNFWSFWNNRWRGLGWITGGYHEIILRDGTVELCYDPNMQTNGVGGQNSYTYHICVVGNGSFTKKQIEVFVERANIARKRFNLGINDVVGHRELPAQTTLCPATDMNAIRQRLSTPVQKSSSLGRDCQRYVCKGDRVKELQEDLMDLGYELPKFGADADFGAETENSVKKFQTDYDISSPSGNFYGIAGNQTITKIKELIAMSKFYRDTKDHWAKSDIEWATEKGYLKGGSDGNFRPNDPLTRAELAVVLRRFEEKNK